MISLLDLRDGLGSFWRVVIASWARKDANEKENVMCAKSSGILRIYKWLTQSCPTASGGGQNTWSTVPWSGGFDDQPHWTLELEKYVHPIPANTVQVNFPREENVVSLPSNVFSSRKMRLRSCRPAVKLEK